MNEYYTETVRLLLDVIPYVFKNNDFALKGGTAINLFCRNMPRLSIDLDLTYTKFSSDRKLDLDKISKALLDIQTRLKKLKFIVEEKRTNEKNIAKLIIKRGIFQVKVEVNYVIRGTILPVEERIICTEARDFFKMECSAPLLSESEIYAGKLIAALDRQHPRDLYDVFNLYNAEGLSENLIENFVCYLCCHNRPFKEVLFGNDKDISKEFESQFVGMTAEPVDLKILKNIRSKLKSDILNLLTKEHKTFLLSFAQVEPLWELMKCKHLKDLPAIRWKLNNLRRLKSTNPEKLKMQYNELYEILKS